MSLEPSSPEPTRRRASTRAISDRTNSIHACYGLAGWKANQTFRPLQRTRVVGIFPTLDSLMRMVGTLLAEQDDEWQVADCRYFTTGSMARVDELEGGEDPTELLAAIA